MLSIFIIKAERKFLSCRPNKFETSGNKLGTKLGQFPINWANLPVLRQVLGLQSVSVSNGF